MNTENTTIEKVVEAEQECIKERRKCWRKAIDGGFVDSEDKSEEDKSEIEKFSQHVDKDISTGSVGIAFSGGGIRSACFSLGIVQGMAKARLWRYFDYLSTVSGGGYLGTLLSTKTCQDRNQPEPKDRDLPFLLAPEASTGNGENKKNNIVNFLTYSGRYLRSPIQLVSKYFFGLILLNGFVLSALMFLATAIALAWRSMDTPPVRERLEAYFASTGLQMFDWVSVSLITPFIPSMFLISLWSLVWILAYFKRGSEAATSFGSWLFVSSSISLLIGGAVILGNGDIGNPMAFSDPETGAGFKIPNAAGTVILSLLLSSLLPLLNIRRFFKSGLSNKSKWWERLVFSITSTGLLVGLPLVLIGFISKENLSGEFSRHDRSFCAYDIEDSAWPIALALSEEGGCGLPQNIGQDPQHIGQDPQNGALALAGSVNKYFLKWVEENGNAAWNSCLRSDEWIAITDNEGKLKVKDKPKEIDGNTVQIPENIRRLNVLKSGLLIPDYVRGERAEAVTALESYISQIDWNRVSDNEFVTCDYLNKSISYAVGIDPRNESSSSYKTLIREIYIKNGTPIRELVCYIRIATQLYTESRDSEGSYHEIFVAKQRMIALMSIYGQIMNEWLEQFDTNCGIPQIGTDTNNDFIQLAGEKPSSNDHLSSFLLGVSNSHLNGKEKRSLGRHVVGAIIPGIYVDSPQRRIVIHADQNYRWWILGISAMLSFVFLFGLDLNATSLHKYYRDRLTATFCFPKKENSERNDGKNNKKGNFWLSELIPHKFGEPYHIINARSLYPDFPWSSFSKDHSLNSLESDNPLSELFVFTQKFCGSPLTGFANTEEYEESPPGSDGELDVAEAMSLSGAAVTPGFHRHFFLAAITFVLNLRLGQWLPRPSRSASGWITPFKVLRDVCRSDSDRQLCFVSDGGHCENLGLISLLQRKCRIIVVIDGTADPDQKRQEFVRSDRLARLHLGINISELVPGSEFETLFDKVPESPRAKVSQLEQAATGTDNNSDQRSKMTSAAKDLDKAEERAAANNISSHQHFWVARVDYNSGQDGRIKKEVVAAQTTEEEQTVPLPDTATTPTDTGILIYFSLGVNGDEPSPIAEYNSRNEQFPHESTGDQFFEPDQVDAYRLLGSHSFEAFFDVFGDSAFDMMLKRLETFELGSKNTIEGCRSPDSDCEWQRLMNELRADVESALGSYSWILTQDGWKESKQTAPEDARFLFNVVEEFACNNGNLDQADMDTVSDFCSAFVSMYDPKFFFEDAVEIAKRIIDHLVNTTAELNASVSFSN